MKNDKKEWQAVETQHLIMRPLEMQDLEAVYALTSDEDVAKYMRFERHESVQQTQALLKEYIESDKCHGLGIIEKESKKFVGVFVLKQEEEESTDYSLTTFNGKEFWNKGYSTEILQGIKPYAKDCLEAKTLTAYVMSDNKGSCKVLEKNKFQIIETFNFEGAPCPLYVYQLSL